MIARNKCIFQKRCLVSSFGPANDAGRASKLLAPGR